MAKSRVAGEASRLPFPVVAIDTPGCDLDALASLLPKGQKPTGMAFVLLSACDEDQCPDVGQYLRHHPSLSLVELEDGGSLQPDCLHVTPVGHAPTLDGQVVRLQKTASPLEGRRSACSFLSSLAAAQGPLSAAAFSPESREDLACGLNSIERAGGLSIAHRSSAEGFADGKGTRTAPLDGTIAHIAGFFARTYGFAAEGEGRELRDGAARIPAEEEAVTAKARIAALEAELRATRAELQKTRASLRDTSVSGFKIHTDLQTANTKLKDRIDAAALINDDLANFLHSTRMAIVIVDRGLQIRTFTREALEVFPFEGTDRGRRLLDIDPLIEAPDLYDDLRRCVEEDEKVERVVTTLGANKTFLMRILPYRSSVSGDAIAGATLTFNDITDLKALEEDLRTKTERLGLALHAGGMGVWEYDLRENTVKVDDEAVEFYGLKKDHRYRFDDVRHRIHRDDRERVTRGLEAVERRGVLFEEIFRVVDLEGSVRWLKGVGAQTVARDGRPKISGLTYDVTFEQEARQAQSLLIREMNHRVKNLFAVVSSLIGTTSRNATDLPSFARSLRSRVDALARAYEITQDRRVSASINFEHLLISVLTPFDAEKRTVFEGPRMDVPIGMVTPIGLIIHELATNAVKYGGLSGEEGDIVLRWGMVDTDRISLEWTERRPNAAPQPGKAGGFGTTLVDASVRQLRGSIKRQWLDEGLKVTFILRVPQASTAPA